MSTESPASSETQRSIWFPAKRYGYGWGIPCAWQGWAVMVAYVLGVIASSIWLLGNKLVWWHVAAMFAMTAALILVCWWKGEPARWRWGGK